jgi:hypothetical protein
MAEDRNRIVRKAGKTVKRCRLRRRPPQTGVLVAGARATARTGEMGMLAGQAGATSVRAFGQDGAPISSTKSLSSHRH